MTRYVAPYPLNSSSQIDIRQKLKEPSALCLPDEPSRLASKAPKSTSIQALRQQAPPVRIAEQNADLIAAPIEKHEEPAMRRPR
jgi:hypothetical protein